MGSGHGMGSGTTAEVGRLWLSEQKQHLSFCSWVVLKPGLEDREEPRCLTGTMWPRRQEGMLGPSRCPAWGEEGEASRDSSGLEQDRGQSSRYSAASWHLYLCVFCLLKQTLGTPKSESFERKGASCSSLAACAARLAGTCAVLSLQSSARRFCV